MSAVAHIDEYKKGRFYTDEFRGELSWNGYENNNLLRNEGPDANGIPRFTDVAMALGVDDGGDARGVAVADFDNDGDLDLAINHNPGDNTFAGHARATFHVNEIGNQRSWLAVELEGTLSNRDAVGATVTLETAGAIQLRLVSAGSAYASQNSKRLYFGLDDQAHVDRLSVRWPSGLEETFDALDARQLVRIVEGQGIELLSLPSAPAPLALGDAP